MNISPRPHFFFFSWKVPVSQKCLSAEVAKTRLEFLIKTPERPRDERKTSRWPGCPHRQMAMVAKPHSRSPVLEEDPTFSPSPSAMLPITVKKPRCSNFHSLLQEIQWRSQCACGVSLSLLQGCCLPNRELFWGSGKAMVLGAMVGERNSSAGRISSANSLDFTWGRLNALFLRQKSCKRVSVIHSVLVGMGEALKLENCKYFQNSGMI